MSADKTSFRAFLTELDLVKSLAVGAQRIGALPEPELVKACDTWRERGELLHYADLIVIARPYWYKESRERKHRSIHDHAIDNMLLDSHGPFPLIYADPPWQAAIIALFRVLNRCVGNLPPTPSFRPSILCHKKPSTHAVTTSKKASHPTESMNQKFSRRSGCCMASSLRCLPIASL
jgi:hypothetical protein